VIPGQIEARIADMPLCLIGMEACVSLECRPVCGIENFRSRGQAIAGAVPLDPQPRSLPRTALGNHQHAAAH
jgi:hypothetical protein